MPESKHRRRRNRAGSGRGRGATPIAPSRSRRRKTNWLYISASALIAVLVIGGFALGSAGFGHGGGITRGGSSNEYVEGVGVQQDIMPTRSHLPESQTVSYSTVPPTSGDHWERWSQCGFFEHELADERIVHNLEHGNIVVSYHLTSDAEIEALRAAYDSIGLSRIWGIARSYDDLPEGTIALSAWGVLDTMQSVDRDRIERFFDTYAGNLGPERILCTQGGIMDPPPGQ